MSPDNVLDVMEAAVVVLMFVVVFMPVGMLMLVGMFMPVGMLMLVVVFVPMGVFVLVGMFVRMPMGGRFLLFLHPVYCHMHAGSCDAAFYGGFLTEGYAGDAQLVELLYEAVRIRQKLD